MCMHALREAWERKENVFFRLVELEPVYPRKIMALDFCILTSRFTIVAFE